MASIDISPVTHGGKLCSLTYLWQARVTSIDYHPTNLNNLGAILGHVDAMLITRRCNMGDAVLLEGRVVRGRGGRIRRLRSRAGPFGRVAALLGWSGTT